MRSTACIVLCAATLVLTGPVKANVHLDAIEELPVAEQYRQLSLMLLVTAGARRQNVLQTIRGRVRKVERRPA